MYFAYILKSLKDKRFYYGSTSDIQKRLGHHNSGMVKSTKIRQPLKLRYYEEFKIKAEAQRRERYFKSIDGYNCFSIKGFSKEKLALFKEVEKL